MYFAQKFPRCSPAWGWLGYHGIFQVNWWLKSLYFPDNLGIHDRELWRAMRKCPLKLAHGFWKALVGK